MYNSGSRFTANFGHKTGQNSMNSRFENNSLIYEEAMSQPIHQRPLMKGGSNQYNRPGFNINQRRALVVTNPN